MLKFAVQPGGGGVQNQGQDQGQSLTSPTSPNEPHTHHLDSNNNTNALHSDHSKGTTSEKKGDCEDCAICSARRLVITQEKSLVRRARSRSRDRLQNTRRHHHHHHHSTSTDTPTTSSEQSSTDAVSDSSDAPTVIEGAQQRSERVQESSDKVSGSGGDVAKGRSAAGDKKTRGLLAKTKIWRSLDETSTSSSDGDSMNGRDARRSRSSSRSRKRSSSSNRERSRDHASSGTDDGVRRSRSHSKGRKRSIDGAKPLDGSYHSEGERTGGHGRRSRSTSRGRSAARQSRTVSDTEAMQKASSESESDAGHKLNPKTHEKLDTRVLAAAESKYRESCRTDVRRRVSSASVVSLPTRTSPRTVNEREVQSCDESRRRCDPVGFRPATTNADFDRRCSLPATGPDGLICANYRVPRVSSMVRKATVRKCRSELDSSGSSCSSDAESTSSGRHSTTSELDQLMPNDIIYECEEDATSCVSVDGSCASDQSSMSTSSNHSMTHDSSNQVIPSSPLSPNREGALSEGLSSRSPSCEISCSGAYCSDSGLSCFDGINPIASETKTAIVKTGEKTMARVRRLNTKVRRSSVGSMSGRREAGGRYIKEDNSSHLNSRELEMLIVGSCFGTGKCFEAHDTSDYESEPGSESLTDSDSQPKAKRSSLEEPSSSSSSDRSQQRVKKIPRNAAASRLASSSDSGSYSPVRASRERDRNELAKMPKSDFSYKAVMQHSHKALSAIELTLKQGASIYLHRKELQILREQSPIWVMAYSKTLNRIGFVPAVYVNIRLEDLV